MSEVSMLVRVRPINIKGVSQYTRDRLKLEVIAGNLSVREERINSYGRGLVIAKVTDALSGNGAELLKLHDAVLLSWSEKKLRMRGFEVLDGVEYAQAWDVEIV